MEHHEHIEQHLLAAADSDAGLNPDEKRAISEHLTNCAECRDRLAAERATKATLKEGIQIVPAPVALRQRILAALDEVDRAQHRAQVLTFRRPVMWMAAASIAACVVLLVVNYRIDRTANPIFDAAIASYQQSEQSFVPTVGVGSNEDLAVALINQFGVPLVWDFSSMGLAPAGGRIDRTADGKVVAYSMYKGRRGSLLCIVDRDDAFRLPTDGQTVKGIHLYRYKGFSIAATNRYAVFCVMVTRLPVADLARAFEHRPT